MQIRFLGGVNEVGRLGMILEHEDGRLLFDYGISPSDPPKYPEKAPEVDAALLSHAHLDHSGFMPWVAERYEMPVVGTPVTKSLSELLARDSLKVCRLEGYPQPFEPSAIHAMTANFETVDYGESREYGGLDVRFHSAGHIPGSTMFEVQNASKTLLFTGDINLVDTRLVEKAQPVKCDVLVAEATYAGRQHPDRGDVEEAFLNAVDGVVAQGGKIVIPAFATGRSQEILMILADEGYNVCLDGMGKTVSKLMLDEPSFCRSPREFSRAVERTRFVRTHSARKRALEDADVVVTTSGMMEGGPVMWYMEQIRNDPKSAVFLTGYQVEGSNGRKLKEERRWSPDEGPGDPVKCDVRTFDFSGHAGHDEIVAFAKACQPEKIVFFHSDKREPLRDALQDVAEVILPETGDVIDLDA